MTSSLLSIFCTIALLFVGCRNMPPSQTATNSVYQNEEVWLRVMLDYRKEMLTQREADALREQPARTTYVSMSLLQPPRFLFLIL